MNIIDKDQINDHDLVVLDCGYAISVDDLYQAFKERMIIELKVVGYVAEIGVEGKLIDGGNNND